jgi:hypothetical protein
MSQTINALGTIYSNYGNVSVNGTTPVLIVSANPNRQELRLINYSTAPDVFLGMDTAVTTTNGWPLFSGSEQDSSRGFGSMYLGPVYAVNNGTGASDIRYWETCR